MSSKYTTIQIRKKLYTEFSAYCAGTGYKISGLVEQFILSHISGSINNNNTKKK